MDSDSDSDFVSFGTPLEIIEEDEPLPKPISVQDQVVHDRQGRQRFHGAFTGGFSAGFFNTVGSKEGFTPSTFVSSRGKKADQYDHKPEDYMDEDDKGEYGIAPRKLVTTRRFAGEEVGSKKRLAPDVSIIPDDGRIQDIIKPTDETSGARLLRRMGWKPGQGVGPKMERKKKGKRRKKKKGGDDGKVYGCARPPILEPQGDDEDNNEDDKEDDEESPNEDSDEEDFMRGFLFAPDDIQDFMFALKDDQHGIGYQGMDSRSILGGHVTLFDDPVMKQNRRQGIKGSAFGIGAFEDEEESDVYSSDRMSNYDRVLGGEEEKQERRMYGWTGPPPQRSSDADVLDGFKGASQKKISTKVFQPPTLPRDFRPFHHFETSSGQTPDLSKPEPQTHSRFTLSADQRAGMLGEEQLPGPASIDELLTSRDLALLKDARNKASRVQGAPQHQSRWDRGAPSWSAPTQEAMPQGGGSGFQPFAKDAEKQHRYNQYLQNRHKGSEMAAVDSRTEWEKQQEMEEFSRAASLYHKPMSGLMASRFVRAKHTDDADDTQEAPAETEGDVNDQCKAAEMKMFGQLTRDTMEWHPDKLLCKRFNVADPYPESSIVGLPTVKKDKFSVFNFLEIQEPASAQMDIYPTQPGLSKLVSKEVEEPGQSSSSSSSSFLKRSRWDQHPGILANVGSKQEVKGDESQGTGKIAEYDVPSQDSTADSDDKPRPPLDLFQAIFLDSDSSSSSSDSSDEYDRDENDDQKKPEGAPQSELQPVQGLESSRGVGNAKENDGLEASKQNEHASYMTRLESVDDEQVMRELSSHGNRTSGAIHRDGGKERDKEEEEEEVEEEEEEEYGPMLPPSLDHTQESPPKNTESQDKSSTGRRKRRDREKRKEEREKKSKKRKSEHKSRDRSRDRSRDKRKDREKHAKELSSHNSKHEKIKKSKHRHGDRHKHTHHKSSKGRMQKKDASLSSDNEK